MEENSIHYSFTSLVVAQSATRHFSSVVFILFCWVSGGNWKTPPKKQPVVEAAGQAAGKAAKIGILPRRGFQEGSKSIASGCRAGGKAASDSLLRFIFTSLHATSSKHLTRKAKTTITEIIEHGPSSCQVHCFVAPSHYVFFLSNEAAK